MDRGARIHQQVILQPLPRKSSSGEPDRLIQSKIIDTHLLHRNTTRRITAGRPDFTRRQPLGSLHSQIRAAKISVMPRALRGTSRMEDRLLARAATAKRESKWIDFKESFDVNRSGDWCEVIKDLVAMANSGGGVIVFGVRNGGESGGDPVAGLLRYDPAKVTDKIYSYTGEHFSSFEIMEIERGGEMKPAIRVREAAFPLVFTGSGNYSDAAGRQKSAFSNGTVYFRHGAKSEPGNATDLRESLERELERQRKGWLGGIAKVVTAPRGHRVEVVAPGYVLSKAEDAAKVRLVSDPAATSVHRLDPDETHPHRQKELLVEVNRRLAGNPRITGHDNLCVRRVHNIDTSRPEFYYCSKYGSPQYSDAYVAWLCDQFRNDADFFTKARALASARSG